MRRRLMLSDELKYESPFYNGDSNDLDGNKGMYAH